MPTKKNTRRNNRPDHQKGLRGVYESNRRRVIAAADVCPICGLPLDKTKKYPAPDAVTLDHIIPISKGGSVIDIENMQAVHWRCNLEKRAKLIQPFNRTEDEKKVNNRDLPLTFDWKNYRSKDD